MGAITTTILAGLSAVQGISSLAQGIQQKSAYKQQGENAIASATMAATEQTRLSFKESQVEAQNAKDAERRQKLAYLKSGVTLEGSPLLIMEETRRKGAENVEEIIRAGNAASGSIMQDGYNTKSALKAKGREAFMGGVSGAVQSGVNIAGLDWKKTESKKVP